MNINKLKCVTTVMLTTLALTGCIAKKPEAIITVNSQIITKADYDSAYKIMSKNDNYSQLPADMRNNPDSYINLLIKDRIINELIIKKLLDQEIAKKNITVTEEDINDEVLSIIDKIGSKEKFNEIIKQSGVTLAQFKNDVKDDLKVKKLIATFSLTKVSEKEAEKYYKTNIDKFKHPDMVRASHILISADPQSIEQKIKSSEKSGTLSDEEIKAKVDEEIAKKLSEAQKVLAEVKADPTQFAKIAKEKSQDPGSADKGGDLGFFTYDQMVEPFAKAAFAQKLNVIGDIVQSQYGYHIILVTDRQKAGVEPLDKVKTDIIALLENQKKVDVLQGLVENLKNKAEIIYDDPAFDPAVIQEKLKREVEKNPAFGGQPQTAKE